MASAPVNYASAIEPLPLAIPDRRAVNLRSVLLGLLGVLFICLLTPFNDFVVNNTFFVGNFLPIGLLLVLFTVVMVVNGPLSRYAPRWALSSGELSVATGMMLVACCLPSSGFMRYVPPHIAGLPYYASQNGDYMKLLEELNLPDWVFPKFTSHDWRGRASDSVVTWFVNRAPFATDTFTEHFRNVPWAAWLQPALTWGLFCTFLFGAVLCLSVIVRKQWAENERLPFPLASVYLSVIEQPEPGKALNTLFSARSFWIAAAVVFIIHGFNALNQYDNRVWPAIQINFNMGSIFSNPPWAYLSWGAKGSRLYFCVIGITFFLQTKIAFSLWFFFLLMNLVGMIAGSYQTDLSGAARQDQMFGALIPFALSLIWVGRHHWIMILRHMVFGRRDGEDRGRYLPYIFAGWGFALCVAGLSIWLMRAGASVAGAIVIVAMLFLFYLVMMRIVAETGLMFVQLIVPLNRPWVYLANNFPGALTTRTTLASSFWGQFVHGAFGHDLRECLPVFSTHALKVADVAAYENERRDRRGIGFFLCLVLALGVGYISSGASTLYCEYTYSSTLEQVPSTPLNAYGSRNSLVDNELRGTMDFHPPQAGPREVHNRLGHFTAGAVITTTLSVLRLRYINWPLHPVGYLLCFSYPMEVAWFSIFVGWLAKVLIIRFGGTDLFRSSRSFFIGLIIGEAGAAAFWLLVSLARLAMGMEYRAIRLLPG